MDAFMFLLAIIALSSFLLATQMNDDVTEYESYLEMVERAHVVLFSTTLQVPSNVDQEGIRPSVELISLVQGSGSKGEMEIPEWAKGPVLNIISGLLGTGWGYVWQVTVRNHTSSLAHYGAPSEEDQIYVSQIALDTENEQTMAFTLRAWRTVPTWAY